MKRMVDDKEIRNFDDRITALEQGGTVDVYTKAESDAKFQTISGMSTYATKSESVLKDSNGNVDGILQVEHLQSEDWEEDDDCKAHVYLVSGERRSRVTLESEGEESGSSIVLQGTTATGSEGTVQISGTTNFTTDNRITVTDGNNNVESIAYQSDIPNIPTYTASNGVKKTDNNFEVDTATFPVLKGLKIKDIYNGSSVAEFAIVDNNNYDSIKIRDTGIGKLTNGAYHWFSFDKTSQDGIAQMSDIVSSSVNVHYIKITDSTDFEVYCTLITNSGNAFNLGTLTAYLNTNSLRVTATGKASDGFDSNIPALFVTAIAGLTPGTVNLAIGMLTSSGVYTTAPANPTVTDTVITVKAI